MINFFTHFNPQEAEYSARRSTDYRIPKSLEECKRPDETTVNLKTVSILTLGTGSLIIALFSLVVLIIIFVVSSTEIGYDEFKWGFFLPAFFIWLFCTIIAWLIVYIISLILDAFSDIVQSTKITAKVALYNASIAEAITEQNPQSADTNSSIEELDGIITCPACGYKNEDSAICNRCGRKLS